MMNLEDAKRLADFYRKADERRQYARSWRGRLNYRWQRIARACSWCVIEGPFHDGPDGLHVRVRVRKWHPVLWWHVARAVRVRIRLGRGV